MERCRVCDAECEFRFEKIHLKKHKVKYFQCRSCESIQTEEPFWINEAYAISHIFIDTGICERGRLTCKYTLALALIAGFTQEDICIDIGGGTGLLTRNLRDFGLNAYWSDRYSSNVFAVGFEKSPSLEERPKLFTAFEVFEHFTRPQEEICSLLSYKPDFLLFSTKLFKGQDSSWWYFLNDGQHVQLYSKRGFDYLAKKNDYHFYTDNDSFHLFSKEKQNENLLKKIHKFHERSEKKAKKKWGSRIGEDHKKVSLVFG